MRKNVAQYEFVRKHYADRDAAYCAAALGCTEDRIYKIARALGIKADRKDASRHRASSATHDEQAWVPPVEVVMFWQRWDSGQRPTVHRAADEGFRREQTYVPER